MKATLEELYRQQQHYGTCTPALSILRGCRAMRAGLAWSDDTNHSRARRAAGIKHGLERTTNARNAVLWHFQPSSPEMQSTSGPFARECLKLLFAQIDAGRDRDAGRVAAAMTPARRNALQPQSVLEVLDAVDGACTSAPPFSALVAATRHALRSARAMLIAGAGPGVSSPTHKKSTKRRKDQGGRAEITAFSPHLEAVSTGGVREQLLELYVQLAELTVAHLLATCAPGDRIAYLEDELDRLNVLQCERIDDLEMQVRRTAHTEARWRVGNVRRQLRTMTRIIADHFRPLANRTADAPIDKAGLLAALRTQCPTAYFIQKCFCTTGLERDRSRQQSQQRRGPEQKIVDGLVPFSVYAAIARPKMPIMDLPLRVVLHNLAVGKGAGRAEMRVWSALHLTPTPHHALRCSPR